MEDEPPGTSENPPVSEEDFVLVEVKKKKNFFPDLLSPQDFHVLGPIISGLVCLKKQLQDIGVCQGSKTTISKWPVI
jgi:hypothetical protein